MRIGEIIVVEIEVGSRDEGVHTEDVRAGDDDTMGCRGEDGMDIFVQSNGHPQVG